MEKLSRLRDRFNEPLVAQVTTDGEESEGARRTSCSIHSERASERVDDCEHFFRCRVIVTPRLLRAFCPDAAGCFRKCSCSDSDALLQTQVHVRKQLLSKNPNVV
ncbi:hypothetical protein F2P81_020445 [Scophthalmus maximus]|uniref:Uncharacterized protein n=1 Tax=Scophthalmus maximus TaxID=52904 RepID=A0A6A4SAC8_SCOMX|nr:hypothetical protein F2P81_020445 [Scophthalmus maximus]